MIRRFAGFALLTALLSPLGACMQQPSNAAQEQWLSTLQSCPPGYHGESFPVGMGGYRCVAN